MNLIKRIGEQADNIEKLIDSKYFQPGTQAYNASLELLVLRSKLQTWQRESCISFRLSNKLVEAFHDTDIPLDMYPTECKFPFDCFMVESHTPLFFTDITGYKAPIYNILFMTGDIANKWKTNLGSNATFVHNDGTFAVDTMKVKWQVGLTAFYELKTGVIGNKIDCLESMVFDADETKTLNQIIETKSLASPTMLPLDSDDIKGLLNIFFNTVLYVNDTIRVKTDTQEERIEKLRVRKGGEFIDNRCILLKPPKDYLKSTNIEATELSVRFRVRGHWRNQAYGEKLSERKRIWIKPHFKGPELSEVLSKNYSVK